MADDENIYVDASQPATLHDGTVHTDYYTAQEAKIAWDQLPSMRQPSATISAGGRHYTAQEINRWHYGPKPTEGLPTDAAARSDASTQTLSSIRIVPNVSADHNISVSTTPAAGVAPSERESLAASSGGMASGRAELTLSPEQAGSDSIQRTLSDHPIPIANAARALAGEVAAQIQELKQSKPNDPGRLAQYDALIPFLERVASGLVSLADDLDRLVTADGPETPLLLGKAAEAARWLQKAANEWLQANRTMVIDVPVRIGLFGLSVAFVHQLGIDNAAVTASLVYLAGLRSTQPRN